MDFYITKYQGKPMESLTPFFMAMTGGIHRLEQQEQQEQQAAATAEKIADAEDAADEPARKRRRCQEHLQRRARRVTIRLASMANGASGFLLLRWRFTCLPVQMRCRATITLASSHDTCNGPCSNANGS